MATLARMLCPRLIVLRSSEEYDGDTDLPPIVVPEIMRLLIALGAEEVRMASGAGGR